MQQSENNRLAQYSLGTVAVSGLSLVAQSAGAAIIPFSDNGSFIEGTVDDGDQGAITINLPDATTLVLDPYTATDYFEIALSGNGLWDNDGTTFFGYYALPNVLGSGEAINPTAPNASDSDAVANVVGYGSVDPAGDWVNAFTDQYIGFLTDAGNEGYLQVSWNPTSGEFSYNGGAIEDSGADLLAGETAVTTPPGPSSPVPVPATLALLCAGAVGAARRYRTQKLAA